MRGKANISYTDSRGNVFDLMVDSFRRITTANFHNYSWQKETTETRFGEKLRAWKKDAAQYAVTIYFDGDKKEKNLNEFHDALEIDIINNNPGILRWEEYQIVAYGISSKTYPASDALNSATANDVTFYCPSPWWTKTIAFSSYSREDIEVTDVYIRPEGTPFKRSWFSRTEGGPAFWPIIGAVFRCVSEGEYKDHRFTFDGDDYIDLTPAFIKTYDDCYDYQYDYMVDYNSFIGVYNDNTLGSRYILTVHGPAVDPFVKIANLEDDSQNVRIAINTRVPDGAKLIINSLDKSVLKYMPDGTIVNCFGSRNLDTGYLWNRVSYGQNRITWDGSFKFDLQLIEERSEPKWLTD